MWTMSSTGECSVYGLTDEEATVLERDDEEFYSDVDNFKCQARVFIPDRCD